MGDSYILMWNLFWKIGSISYHAAMTELTMKLFREGLDYYFPYQPVLNAKYFFLQNVIKFMSNYDFWFEKNYIRNALIFQTIQHKNLT